MTHFVVECNDKQKLQRICDAVVKCNSMTEPLVPNSASHYVGNIFKSLGLKHEYDRSFWYESYFADDALHVLEESAWSRGSSMRQLVEQMNDPEDPDNDLVVYFRSEECGCEIYETNDTEGVHFPERYIFDTSEDGEGYYSTFEGFCDDVNSYLEEQNNFKTFDDVVARLDEYNRENEYDDRWAYVHEFDTEVSL